MIIHDCSGERLYYLDAYLMGMLFRILQGELLVPTPICQSNYIPLLAALRTLFEGNINHRAIEWKQESPADSRRESQIPTRNDKFKEWHDDSMMQKYINILQISSEHVIPQTQRNAAMHCGDPSPARTYHGNQPAYFAIFSPPSASRIVLDGVEPRRAKTKYRWNGSCCWCHKASGRQALNVKMAKDTMGKNVKRMKKTNHATIWRFARSLWNMSEWLRVRKEDWLTTSQKQSAQDWIWRSPRINTENKWANDKTW